MPDATQTPAGVYPEPAYEDAAAAVEWLSGAFGLAVGEVVRDPDGTVIHAELHRGAGVVMPKAAHPEIGSRSPRQLAAPSQDIYVTVEDPDAHCERARAHGAEILFEPSDMHYGARNYSARDPEGHVWTFGTYVPRRP